MWRRAPRASRTGGWSVRDVTAPGAALQVPAQARGSAVSDGPGFCVRWPGSREADRTRTLVLPGASRPVTPTVTSFEASSSDSKLHGASAATDRATGQRSLQFNGERCVRPGSQARAQSTRTRAARSARPPSPASSPQISGRGSGSESSRPAHAQ